ncbi:hypothetical protein [Maricaulis sp.]|uniref:hypothetical protein n=1 Tax=Maricaulis sp. TaxID=1486257 RepID=UPI003A956097
MTNNPAKFMNKRYADALLNVGSIRIGTLEDFRQLEHGGLISDPMEGAVVGTIANFNGAFRELESSNSYGWAKNSIRGFSPDQHIEIVDSSYFRTVDHYVFCASRTLSRQTRGAAEATGYDACVEIIDPMRFGYVISNRLRQEGLVPHSIRPLFKFDAVRYQTREFDASQAPCHPPDPYIKRQQFSSQEEVRWVFPSSPRRRPLNPINYVLPELISCCARAY